MTHKPTPTEWQKIWRDTIDAVPPCSVCAGELVLAKRELDHVTTDSVAYSKSIWRCPKCWEGENA